MRVHKADLISRLKGLYVVTGEDFSKGRTTSQVVEACIRGGARVIQLREKNWDGAKLISEGLKIRTMTKEAGVMLIVNDRIDVAMALEADGVHVGQRDIPLQWVRKLVGPDVVIGVSTGSLEEAVIAEKGGADYVGVGPVFPTETKKDAEAPKGLEMLQDISKAISLPVIGIGGINMDNAADVIRRGAVGAAVVSAVTGADDIARAAGEMVAVINKAFV